MVKLINACIDFFRFANTRPGPDRATVDAEVDAAVALVYNRPGVTAKVGRFVLGRHSIETICTFFLAYKAIWDVWRGWRAWRSMCK